MARCPACNEQNPERARFCLSCGSSIATACKECGTPLPPNANFCHSCGAAVSSGVPTTEMIKLVTVLFGDVVGSTAQAERMEPEDIRELMAEFFDTMSEEIRRQGGTVERLIGDAIMADFGVPLSREDDAVRAVRAALAMLEQLEVFNSDKPPELQVQMRIGVNTGEVSTGGSLGEQLLVMGDAVNVAARLEQAADPGTVVIGERTARAVRHRFDLVPLEALSVKGKSDAINAFVVRAELSEDQRPSLTAPLVGRSEELQEIQAAFGATIRERRPHSVAIVGEAGIGKSRLKREFLQQVESKATILRGRCLPYGEGVTLWPLREVLTEVARLESSDATDVALGKIEALAVTLVGEGGAQARARTVAALASTVGLPVSAVELDPRELYQELVRSWRMLLTESARRRPLVVVIEDFHWADRMLLDVLDELARATEGPILFLYATRPDLLRNHPDWVAAIPDYVAISLAPLSLTDSALLMSEFSAGRTPLADLTDRILAKAEGNPFFLEEIIQQLLDEGSIAFENGLLTARREVSEIELPDTVQAAILSRLDLIPSIERSVTQHAAVVGRTFWTGSVRELVPVAEIEAILRALRQRQMIDEGLTSSIDGDVEHSFRHILIRDVAYQTLPRKSRGEAHAKTARWIERVRGDRAGEAAELLAHHYEQAYHCLRDDVLRVEARRYSLRAAQDAVRKFAIQQAELFGHKAVELSQTGPERIEALHALGDLYTLTFKSDGAWTAFREAVEEHDRAGGRGTDLARLAGKAAIVPTRWRGTMQALPDGAEILRLIERGLAAAEPGDPAARSLLLSSKAFYVGLFGSATDAGEADGRAVADEAAELAREARDPNLVSVAMDAAVCCLMPQGSWKDIDLVNRQRVDLVPSLRDAREACDAYAMAAYSSIRIGHYDDAADFATRCVDRAAGVDAGSYLQGLVWRIAAFVMLGRWDEALRDHDDVERLQRENAGATPGSMAMRAYAAATFCRELRGDAAAVDASLEVISRFIEMRRAGGSTAGGVEPDIARALAHRGDYDAALSLLTTEPGAYRSVHLEAMCDVLARFPDARAPEVLALARAEQARAGLSALSGFCDRLEASITVAAGDREGAARHFDSAARTFAGLRAPWEEAWSRLLLGEVHAHANAAEAERELSVALGIFQRLGSLSESERASSVLAAL